MDTSDRDLLSRVRAGDRQGLHDLVRRHSEPIWGTLRRQFHDLEDVRDVFQETWLRAFECLDGVREPERFRAWLLSIAFNLVRRHRRKNGSRREVPGDDAGLADPREEVGESLSRQETVSRIRELLEALPPRQREVVDLRLNHELSHAEIADLLGIAEESSRANYYQALRRLRSAFREERAGEERE